MCYPWFKSFYFLPVMGGSTMPTKESSRYRSATWWDVKVYALEVGKAHNGYVGIQTSFNVPERIGKACHWTVCWWPKNRPISEGYLLGVGQHWPHVDHTTVTDMVMAMIFELDFKLTERERAAERQTQF